MSWNNQKIREKLRMKKRAGRGARNEEANYVSWDEVPGPEITQALDIVCAAGGCLRMGTSRDRSTYSVGFYLGDAYFTEYFRDIDELRDFLANMSEVVKLAMESDHPGAKKDV